MPRPRSWTDERLAAAVAASRTLAEVHQRLGLDASHIPRGVAGDTRRTRRWTDDDLRAAVEGARSVHDVIRRLGFEPSAV